MNIFKINITKSKEAFMLHGKITCPVAGHGGYVQMGKVKKGDLIILMSNNRVYKVGVAKEDSFVGNISYYDLIPAISNRDFFTLEVSLLPVEISENLTENLASLFANKPLFSQNFCLQCYPYISKLNETFIPLLNKALFNTDVVEEKNNGDE